MLKKRDLHECHVLFDLMTHPDVFPFVRQKANSYEEFLFLTKQVIELEENGDIISRTILDEWGSPIGTINLFDIQHQCGFLGTWIGHPYHGKGYNRLAKEAFFQELFLETDIETVWLSIRKVNLRSQRAAEKLPYIMKANEFRQQIYSLINQHEDVYDLYEVSKNLFLFHQKRNEAMEPVQILEA